jgi:hypothetical protein
VANAAVKARAVIILLLGKEGNGDGEEGGLGIELDIGEGGFEGIVLLF